MIRIIKLSLFPGFFLVIALCFGFLGAQSRAETHLRISQEFANVSNEQPLLSVSVTNDKGYSVTGLNKDNFSVLVDKKPAQIIRFTNADAPVSVGILFDASTSVKHSPQYSKRFETLREGLGRFLEVANEKNEYFVLAFNANPELLLDWTSDRNAVIEKLSEVRPQGNTAFFDTCYLALNKLEHGRYAKRVLLIISDGQDNASHYSYEELLEAVKRSDAILYAINIVDRSLPGSTLLMDGARILEDLSSISGGRAFSNDFDERRIKAIFEFIPKELHDQYAISFSSNVLSKNKWHKIKLNVTALNLKNLQVRTRAGYYDH